MEVTLERQDHDHVVAFEDAVGRIGEVMECYALAGRTDYMLRVHAKDAQRFARLHSEQLTRLPGVAKIECHVALREVVRRTDVSLPT